MKIGLPKIANSLCQNNLKKLSWYIIVRHRTEQNRVTWETPSSEAFPLLQESVGVLASYVPHTQMQV